MNSDLRFEAFDGGAVPTSGAGAENLSRACFIARALVVLFEGSGQFAHDECDLLAGKFRVHRQRENPRGVGGRAGNWLASSPDGGMPPSAAAAPGNVRPSATLRSECAATFAGFHLYDVEVIYVARLRAHHTAAQLRHVREPFVVPAATNAGGGRSTVDAAAWR